MIKRRKTLARPHKTQSPHSNVKDSERGQDLPWGTQTAAPPTTIPERMRASVLTAPLTLSIEQVPTPPMASDEVLVEVAAVGVCGSDTHYYRHGRIGTSSSKVRSSSGMSFRAESSLSARRYRRQGSVNVWPSSHRRTVDGAESAELATTTSAPTWSSTPRRLSMARSRSTA